MTNDPSLPESYDAGLSRSNHGEELFGLDDVLKLTPHKDATQEAVKR
jgi:hypothetical protein